MAVVAYDLEFPDDPLAGPATPWTIESTCYAEYARLPDAHRRQYGREHHLRQLMLMLYPKVLGAKGEHWDQYWDEMTWGFCNHQITTVMGFAGLGKTFRAAHIVFAAYLASPLNTAVSLTTVTLDALKNRLYADMLSASRHYPGMVSVDYKYRITIPKPPEPTIHDKRMVIEGFATANTRDAAGRIQGLHAPHRYFIIDEGMEAGEAVFNALPNLMVDPDTHGFILGNPRERFSPFGQKCKPTGGWADERYVNGGHVWEVEGSVEKQRMVCLRYDARKSPNYAENRVVQPWAPTRAHIDAMIAQRRVGRGELAFWMYCAADFAPDGTIEKVFPQAVVLRGDRRITFAAGSDTFLLSTCDPGFGGDACVQSIFRAGVIEPNRFGLELVEQIEIAIDRGNPADPPDNQVGRAVRQNCLDRQIDPGCHITDTTGRGAGVHAYLIREWGLGCLACEFGSSPSENMIRESDPKTPKESFRFKVDELWFAASTWMEEGQLSFGPVADVELREDLVGRLVEISDAGKRRIEPKDEYKVRLGRSPDKGDSFCLGVELMRRKGAIAGLRAKWQTQPDVTAEALESRHKVPDDFSTPMEQAMIEQDEHLLNVW